VICAVVSVVTGSSWTTAGTVGIALIGVGEGLGIGAPMAAGAVISGAYFGDKMSPLSDTTNLAAGVAGVELFAHVRHMMWISVPSLLLAVGLFAVLGWRQGGAGVEAGEVEAMRAGLGEAYRLTAWLWVVPVAVLGLVVARVPALPTLVAGVGLGGGAAVLVQGVNMGEVWVVAYQGVTAATGIEAVDALLSRGGMSSMYGTVSLILCAMCFGGVMERSGCLERLATAVLGMVRGSRGGLVAATVGTSAGMNVVASDQYLSLVVPGRMYRPAYARAGLHEKNLSRALEDGGTLTSPLVPWNTCGAYMAATLGVFPLAYLPYTFFNLINPVLSVVVGYLGWTMTAATKETAGNADAAGGEGADAGNTNEKGSTHVFT
jgi:NhaC family Na+:H+ antiporter